jgi:hypothetical protein
MQPNLWLSQLDTAAVAMMEKMGSEWQWARRPPPWSAIFDQLKALESALRTDPALKEFDGTEHQGIGLRGAPAYGALAMWLIERTLRTNKAQVFSDLEAYLGTETFPFTLHFALLGIRPSAGSLDLGSGTHAGSCDFGGFLRPFRGSLGDGNPWPARDIKMEAYTSGIVPKKSDEGKQGRNPPTLQAAFDRLTTARYCFGLIRPTYVPVAVTALEVPENIPCYREWQYFKEEPLPLWAAKMGETPPTLSLTEASDVKALFSKYWSNWRQIDNKVRIPIQRLESALAQRSNHVDSAIDLGISLESLLLADEAELSFRLSLYGAWLLGVDSATRKTIFDELRMLYTCRSKAVHNGKVDDVIKGYAVADLLPRGYEHAARLIRWTIEHGDRPDGDQYIFGQGLP